MKSENAPLFTPPSATLVQYTKRQMLLGHIFLLPFCGFIAFLMRYVGGYRIENKKGLRKQFKIIAKNNSPLIVASNHLTFIDSTLLIWAMGSNFWYFFNYRFFSWNLPAGDVFKKKWYFRIVAYLGKCIFIHRDGTKEHKEEILSLAHDLVKEGQILTIFPEGRRSRTGRFDSEHITFGVGKIIQNLGECSVLCLYIRGDKQVGHSNYPPRGSKFRPLIKLIKIKANPENRRAYLEIGAQIAENIKGLEEQYFRK